MEKIRNIVRQFFGSPRCTFCFGLLIVLLATGIEVFRHRNTNYFDYYDSTMMFWQGIHAYTYEYVQMFHIYFLYSPVFSVLFAPIFFLPWWLGPFVWNIANYSLFFLAVWTLPKRLHPYRLKIFWFLLSVLLQAVFCYQYNTVLCYIFLFAFTLLERNKPFWAVLLIMISTCTKVYGVVELGLLFCYPKVWRNFGYAILCGVGLLLLPAVFAGVDRCVEMYQAMFEMIGGHHGDSDFVGILFAPGLKPFLLPNYREVQIGVMLCLMTLFFAKWKMWKDFRFRVRALAALMGYVILFSDCPETHTYIIALSGYAMAFWLQDERKWYDWVLFWLLVFNFCIIPTDVLCPRRVHEYIHETFFLDVYTFLLVWLRNAWLAITEKNEGGDLDALGNQGGLGKLGRLEKLEKLGALGILGGLGSLGTLGLLGCLASCTPSTPLNPSTPLTPSPTSTRDKVVMVGDVTFRMKAVRGGTFTMGADAADTLANKDEKPAHRVTVSNFLIGETEVTQELWLKVMGGKNRSCFKGMKRPVDRVTWEQCKEFIARLNKMTGMTFRLPTEAEWEYAARGGRKSHNTVYAGGENLDEVAWNVMNVMYLGIEGSHNVGELRPNELGLYDMTGNVWEWCEDYYGPYAEGYQQNPKGAESSLFRVVRGGSWRMFPDNNRLTNRFMLADWRFEDSVGFRLAM